MQLEKRWPGINCWGEGILIAWSKTALQLGAMLVLVILIYIVSTAEHIEVSAFDEPQVLSPALS